MEMRTKESVVLVYTGDGKGKTSAGLGTLVRSLGAGQRAAFIQFIKEWSVSEHEFLGSIAPIYGNRLLFEKGGKGFYNAGEQSAKGVSNDEHITAAQATYDIAVEVASSGEYDLVVLDEINNAVVDGLLTTDDLRKLILGRATMTSLCLTGRNFPSELVEYADIVTEMKEEKHHFHDGYLAKEGIDF